MRKSTIKSINTLPIILVLAMSFAVAMDDGLVRTPPMGWNHWNEFQCQGITENLFKGIADAFVASGFKDAGYEYLNVDDCWEGERDAGGYIKASDNFTNNSMETLSKYIHDKGLKFGIYTSIGTKTCQQYEGSWGYLDEDARRWAEWEVDYVKVDWCFYELTEPPLNQGNAEGAEWGYKQVYDALQKTDRPMVLSVCQYGLFNAPEWGPRAGHLWRTTFDIGLGWGSFTSILDQNADLYPYSGPSKGWNDPDMLQVGRGMKAGEDRAHFGLWCILAAPLLLGNDLRNMSNAAIQTVTNEEVIAVDQDSLGIQGRRVKDNGDLEVWAKPMRGNARAVGLFNRSNSSREITINWSDLDKWSDFNWEGHGFREEELSWSEDKEVMVRDLWKKQDIGLHSGSFSMEVPGHDLAMLKLFDPNIVDVDVDFTVSKNNLKKANFTVLINEPGWHEIRVMDINGKELEARKGKGVNEYNFTHIKKRGVYFIQITTSKSTNTRKAIIY